MTRKWIAHAEKLINSRSYRISQQRMIVGDAHIIAELIDRNQTIHTIATVESYFQNLTVSRSLSDIEIKPRLLNRNPCAAQLIKLKAHQSIRIDEGTLKRLTKEPAPQGILAEVDLPNLNCLDQVLEEPAVILIDPYHPGNLGAIIRTALCLNWPNVIICGSKSVDVFNYQTVRASKGAALNPHLKISRSSSWQQIHPLIRHHLLLAATEPNMKSVPLGDALKIVKDTLQPVSLVLGNESHGITKEIIDDCNLTVSIPSNHLSLNLAVAGGILMHSLSSSKIS